MDERQFSIIVDKMDKMLKLLAIETVKGKEKEQDKIDLLESIGFKSSEIDRLLGKSPGYSSVVIAQLKKKGQGLVEYALILVLIAIVVILILTFLGGKVNETFSRVGSGLG